MRYLIYIVAFLALAAPAHSVNGQAQEGDSVRRIKVEEARELVTQGKAIIVDVRSQDSYNSGHIKGALWIDLDAIGSRARQLPRNKLIITYCT